MLRTQAITLRAPVDVQLMQRYQLTLKKNNRKRVVRWCLTGVEVQDPARGPAHFLRHR
ncbi:MAG TPA: hypothetical protein VFF81_02220 [Noviherbaspirillum sp.]|nr:hypothetical protein [Noviherbaspirillum sp.]